MKQISMKILFSSGDSILFGTFLTRVLTGITKCPKNPMAFRAIKALFI